MAKPKIPEIEPLTLGWRSYVKVSAVIGLWVVTVFGILAAAVVYLPSPYYLCAVLPATFLVRLVLREPLVETLAIGIILSLLLFLAHSVVDGSRKEPASQSTRSGAGAIYR